MRTIKDESELPLPPADSRQLTQDFIRSLSTPTVDYDSRSGECFQREDGRNWKHPAYTRDGKFDDADIKIWEKLKAATAWFDSAIYPYSEKATA